MATKRPKQVKKLKFELTRSAVVGIGVVSFCLFLWMFLIGVWAGQSLLYPPVVASTGSLASSDTGDGEQVFDVIQLEAHKKKKKF